MIERYDKGTGKTVFENEHGDYVRLTPPPHEDDIVAAQRADVTAQLNAAINVIMRITQQPRDQAQRAVNEEVERLRRG